MLFFYRSGHQCSFLPIKKTKTTSELRRLENSSEALKVFFKWSAAECPGCGKISFYDKKEIDSESIDLFKHLKIDFACNSKYIF